MPSEDSSDNCQRRDQTTKTGKGLVRRVLAEASWHHQHRAGVAPPLAARRVGQPPRVIAIADKAQQRICRRSRRLSAEHNRRLVVAVAREMVSFI